MSYLTVLVPVALLMGLAGLAAFMWTLRFGQYDDLDGAAQRILLDDDLSDKVQSVPPGVARGVKDDRSA